MRTGRARSASPEKDDEQLRRDARILNISDKGSRHDVSDRIERHKERAMRRAEPASVTGRNPLPPPPPRGGSGSSSIPTRAPTGGAAAAVAATVKTSGAHHSAQLRGATRAPSHVGSRAAASSSRAAPAVAPAARPHRTVAQKTTRNEVEYDERDEDLREDEEEEEEEEDDDVEGDGEDSASVGADSDSGRRRDSSREPRDDGREPEEEDEGAEEEEEEDEEEEEVVSIARRPGTSEPIRSGGSGSGGGAVAPANKTAVRAHPPASSSSSAPFASSTRVASTTVRAADSSYTDIAKTLRSLDALVAQKLVAVQRDNDALRDDVRYLTQRIDAQLARSLEEHRQRRVASRDTLSQHDVPRATAAARTHASPRNASGSGDASRQQQQQQQQSVAPRGSVARPTTGGGGGGGGGGGAASSQRQESARSTPQSADGELRHPSRSQPSLASRGGGGDRGRVKAPDVGTGKRPPASTSSSRPNEPRSRPRTR